MQSLAQILTPEQQAMKDSIPKDPPNPPMMPSPYPWSGSYTSPAWGKPIGLIGSGYFNSVPNMFNSSLTQPLGLNPNPQFGGNRVLHPPQQIDKGGVIPPQIGGMWGADQNTEFFRPNWELYGKDKKTVRAMNKIGSGKRKYKKN